MAQQLVLLLVMAAFGIQVAFSAICDDLKDPVPLADKVIANVTTATNALLAPELKKVEDALAATTPAPSAGARACLEALKPELQKIAAPSAAVKKIVQDCVANGLKTDAMIKTIKAACEAAKCNGFIPCIVAAFMGIFGSIVGLVEFLLRITFGSGDPTKKLLAELEKTVKELLAKCEADGDAAVKSELTTFGLDAKITACRAIT